MRRSVPDRAEHRGAPRLFHPPRRREHRCAREPESQRPPRRHAGKRARKLAAPRRSRRAGSDTRGVCAAGPQRGCAHRARGRRAATGDGAALYLRRLCHERTGRPARGLYGRLPARAATRPRCRGHRRGALRLARLGGRYPRRCRRADVRPRRAPGGHPRRHRPRHRRVLLRGRARGRGRGRSPAARAARRARAPARGRQGPARSQGRQRPETCAARRPGGADRRVGCLHHVPAGRVLVAPRDQWPPRRAGRRYHPVTQGGRP